MTFRLPISVEKVFWRDGQKVNQSDVLVDQNHEVQTQAAIINNFFGSGLIPNAPDRTFIFDSESLSTEQSVFISANKFDGYGILPHSQPLDSSLGAQLEIELTDSAVYGRRTVSVLVLGLDFEGTLQYERFVFHRNEIQVGEIHFTRVLGLIFNNFKGNANGSRNYGGTITIRESLPMQLSRLAITSSQNVEPNLFFRDIKLYSLSLGLNITTALKQVISDAVGNSYSVDSLGIKTTGYKTRQLAANDITTRYGQKFLATANNIQKITLLLGVLNDPTTKLVWSGNLVISVYALQSSVTCPSDIVPANAIDFFPDPTPLAQISVNQSQLKERGIVLNDVEQPVDFTFSNLKIANPINSGIEAGKYYMVSIQRIGDASSGNLFTITGNDTTPNAKFTFFNGVTWTDVSAEDMWYEVWSDCFKVSDGMGVDFGAGMFVPKTIIDSETGGTIDYSYDGVSFANGGQNQLNYVVAQAVKENLKLVQDQRTGNNVYSKEIYKTSVSAITSSTLNSIKQTADPIILGCGYDTNTKSSTVISGYTSSYIGLGINNQLFIVDPEPDLLAANLIGCKIFPNINRDGYVYRIVDASLCSYGYGDTNGNGYIDSTDASRALQLVGQDLSQVITQNNIINGTPIGLINPVATTALEILRADVNKDGVVGLDDVLEITNYADKKASTAGSTFKVLVLTVEHNVGRNDGYYDYSDTKIRANPYSSLLTNIADIHLIGDYNLEYYGNPNPVMINSDPDFVTVPYLPLTYSIVNENDYWKEELVLVSYTGRLMPCSFTSMIGPEPPPPAPLAPGQTATAFNCTSRYTPASCPGGHNDFFVPGNLILGGQILRNANQYFPVDYEVGTVIIELPTQPHISGNIDIFHNFIIDIGNGFTSSNYPAMRFADGSTVQSNALDLNQLRFSVAVQSYSPNLDGYTFDDGYGVIVDPVIGINVLNLTGVLQFRAANLYADPTNPILRTRIQVTVQIKKSGWQNQPVSVSYVQSENLIIDTP